MTTATEEELIAIRARLQSLTNAIERERSLKWQLRLWSRFIKTRDAFRCLCCEETGRIQAHHIMRRTLYPRGSLALGNGITMCRACHHQVHAQFNRKPDLSQPLGAEHGDDQDEWAFLFGLLVDDAARRGLAEDEFYPVGESIMGFSVSVQGYPELYEQVQRGQLSQIRFAHEIWRVMPEQFYGHVFSAIFSV